MVLGAWMALRLRYRHEPGRSLVSVAAVRLGSVTDARYPPHAWQPRSASSSTYTRKGAKRPLSTLLPQLADVEVERIDQAADLVQILARTRANQATCPSCGVPSGRTHSRYRRRLADVAVGGRRLVIALTARRLFCDQACQRRTFAEQVPGLTARYQRRTPGLTAMLEAIAVALAGHAGAR
jgi:zinc-finger of transposase IS204/IS1001/IS1096/IS1165